MLDQDGEMLAIFTGTRLVGRDATFEDDG